MKEFVINTKTQQVKFNFPTSLNELSADYLKDITNHIEVADYQVLVGLVYHETLPNLIMLSRNKKKTANIGVNTIFVKAGKSESDFIAKAEIKDRVLISQSQLQLGYQVTTPNKLNLDYLAKCINNTTDEALYEKSVVDSDGREIYLIDFKLVNLNDIMAIYKNNVSKTSPYVEISNVGE